VSHPGEEALVLHHYGEGSDRAVAEHLAACRTCRESYQALRADLARIAVEAVPARGDDYGAAVWRRLEPRLGVASERRARLRRLLAGGAIAASLVVAFLLGRFPSRPAHDAGGERLATAVRERILLLAVGQHLDRSQQLLVELLNGPSEADDLAPERRRAARLAADNRIYRQVSARSGDAAIARVLDDLERALLEVAHAPSPLTPGGLGELRAGLEDAGILFKVRVVSSQLRARQREAAGSGGESS
jgi:hypothetical protein